MKYASKLMNHSLLALALAPMVLAMGCASSAQSTNGVRTVHRVITKGKWSLELRGTVRSTRNNLDELPAAALTQYRAYLPQLGPGSHANSLIQLIPNSPLP